MNQCPACGAAVAETARFCSACGAELVKRPSSVHLGNRRGRCKYCGNEVVIGVSPCPHCGHELKWVRRPVQSPAADARSPSALETARQTETVELSQELERLASWGGHNALSEFFDSLFPFAGQLVRLLLFLLNPFWIVTAAIFGVQGTERLKKGDIDGARQSLFNGRLANWMMILAGLIAWTLFFHYGEPGKRIHRMLHEPKVEVVQSATGSSAATPSSPSIRAEMRQALTGGHVLKVWNTTESPVTCVATLNSPELRTDPVYTFTAQPGAPKPQELGVLQFGHRIKKKPRCSVTIKVEETGEVYKFTP